ncbi:MAG: putative sulfate exporter family transporter [Alicyclobacillaceae bacterium]|nr:putative sulfate exporter family transporter [Alicyclobacillaceae bacterium]
MADRPPEKKRIGEDGWSVIIGLLIVAAAFVAYWAGAPLDFFKKALPVEWPTKSLAAHFAQQAGSYLLLYVVLLILTGLAAWNLRERPGRYALSFTVLFLISGLILVLGSQHTLKYYGLEYPFWALVIGLVIGNIATPPEWFQAAAGRSELYIKTSIVLLGANLPFTIIARAGVWGFLEAVLIVAAGFVTAFAAGKRLGFDPRFSAVIGAGGSVCGVSAAIAVGNSVNSPPKQVGYVVSLVVLYGLALIFVLPVLAKLLHLPDSVAGAWIGGSELADAAGLAAASMVSETAVKSFTLVKLSRDVLIGILCFIFGTLAVARWEAGEGGRVSAWVIWERFPKFVLAFLVVSGFATFGQAQYGQSFADHVTANLNALRTWLFTLTFFCIGLNTRFRDIRLMGGKPIAAFTAVVLVNFVLGFVLANLFFGGFLGRNL